MAKMLVSDRKIKKLKVKKPGLSADEWQSNLYQRTMRSSFRNPEKKKSNTLLYANLKKLLNGLTVCYLYAILSIKKVNKKHRKTTEIEK